MNRFTRDERGAVAVIFGLTAALLLTLCALGVDLGQAWAQKRQLQASSDSATLAGAGIAGNDLPAPSAGKVCGYGTGATSSDPATQDVARYVASRAYSPVIAPSAVSGGALSAMAKQLTDCNVSNGEVFYGMPKFNKSTKAWTLTYNKNQLSLVSPPSNVDFGFAGILGINDVDVVGVSTVEIQSPKMATLPFYAFSGCDYGPQTLQHPGHPVFLIGAPTGGFVDWFQHMTLPAIALALGLVGVYSRYIRSSMLVSLSQPYAVVARAKGLSEGRVVVRHALRNSLIPFVSALSLEIGAIVGASMAADWVFSMGGVATLTIGALGRADPFEMTAVVISLSVIVIVFMTVADLVVGWLDPRARLAAAS